MNETIKLASEILALALVTISMLLATGVAIIIMCEIWRINKRKRKWENK